MTLIVTAIFRSEKHNKRNYENFNRMSEERFEDVTNLEGNSLTYSAEKIATRNIYNDNKKYSI